MEKKLSPLKNKFKGKIAVIILCAGEGKRIRDFIQNIPKPLIELKNKPLLMHIISNLNKPEISSINIITGHLGNEIEKYVSSIKRTNSSLHEKIRTVNSGENYKKGPLFSFLSIANERAILRRNKVFLIIPGDTYFKPGLFTEIFNLLLNNFNIIKKKSIIFYQKIQGNNLKPELDSKKRISIVKLEQEGPREIIKEIQQIQLCDIDSDKEISQIIPIFAFSYKLVNRIINMEKKDSVRTIREIINYLIRQKTCAFYAIPVKSQYRFFDIDTKADYLNIVQKKGDNR